MFNTQPPNLLHLPETHILSVIQMLETLIILRPHNDLCKAGQKMMKKRLFWLEERDPDLIMIIIIIIIFLGSRSKNDEVEVGWKSGTLTSGFLPKLCNRSFDANALYSWNQKQEHS